MNLLSRDEFREAVLKRDKATCVCCPNPATAVHHIMERRLWNDGGYYIDNGVSLCDPDHILAEQTIITPQKLRDLAKIKRVVLPEHLDPERVYDKWGNPYINQNTRARGELFHEEAVQKALRDGGVLCDFTQKVKYPKTLHLAISPGLQNDDRRIESTKGLEGEEVIITLKMDGENTSFSRDYIHARSLDSIDHPSRNCVKALWGKIKHELPEDLIICGENLYAEHSIHYDNLPAHFLVFNMWEKGRRLSWDDTVEICNMLELQHVPVLWRGIWDEKKIEEVCKNLNPETQEGAVIQVTREIRASEWKKTSAKFVRKGHVQTDQFWMLKPIVVNGLAKKPEDISFEGRRPTPIVKKKKSEPEINQIA